MTDRTRTANSVGTEERSDGVKPKSSDLEQITRERDEAVRLLRRWHTVDYPSEALDDITDAFLASLAD